MGQSLNFCKIITKSKTIYPDENIDKFMNYVIPSNEYLAEIFTIDIMRGDLEKLRVLVLHTILNITKPNTWVKLKEYINNTTNTNSNYGDIIFQYIDYDIYKKHTSVKLKYRETKVTNGDVFIEGYNMLGNKDHEVFVIEKLKDWSYQITKTYVMKTWPQNYHTTQYKLKYGDNGYIEVSWLFSNTRPICYK